MNFYNAILSREKVIGNVEYKKEKKIYMYLYTQSLDVLFFKLRRGRIERKQLPLSPGIDAVHLLLFFTFVEGEIKKILEILWITIFFNESYTRYGKNNCIGINLSLFFIYIILHIFFVI